MFFCLLHGPGIADRVSPEIPIKTTMKLMLKWPFTTIFRLYFIVPPWCSHQKPPFWMFQSPWIITVWWHQAVDSCFMLFQSLQEDEEKPAASSLGNETLRILGSMKTSDGPWMGHGWLVGSWWVMTVMVLNGWYIPLIIIGWYGLIVNSYYFMSSTLHFKSVTSVHWLL